MSSRAALALWAPLEIELQSGVFSSALDRKSVCGGYDSRAALERQGKQKGRVSGSARACITVRTR